MLTKQLLAHGSRPPRMRSVMQRSWPLHHAVSDPQLQILGLNLLNLPFEKVEAKLRLS